MEAAEASGICSLTVITLYLFNKLINQRLDMGSLGHYRKKGKIVALAVDMLISTICFTCVSHDTLNAFLHLVWLSTPAS